MRQWQVLPSALAKHERAPVVEGHPKNPAPGNGLRVSLASGVSWPWQLPFGSSLVAALWSRPFLLGMSSPAVSLRPIGSSAFAAPSGWVFSATPWPWQFPFGNS